MQVIRRILYVLAFLTALLCIFIIVCAFRPNVTERIKQTIYRDGDEEVMTDAEPDDYYNVQTDGIIYQPQDTEEPEQDDDTENIEVPDDSPNSGSTQTDVETEERATLRSRNLLMS